jgi:hypothetical protein
MVSADVLNLAVPLDKAPVPRVVVPSMNVTVPVAPATVTVAVKVTELPYADGLKDDTTPVVVDAVFTVCERTDDVDPAKFTSPL